MCAGPEIAVAVEALTATEAAAATYSTFEAMAGMEAIAGWTGAAEAAATYGTFEAMSGAGALGEAVGWSGLGAVPEGFEGFGMGADGSLAAMDTFGSTGWFDSAVNTAANGGFGIGDVKGAMSIASPLMSVGSGLYGLNQADALRKQAALAGRRADPWGASGGRSLADSQLQELMRDPGQVAARDPSYALRMQGAQRASAIHGQDSGAMAVAGANASTDWYNQRLGQLGGLAGATASPASAEQINMSGQLGANDLASKSLASIGYGVTRAGGGAGMPPEVQQWLRSQGMI